MKKYLAVFIVLLVLTAAGCGGQSPTTLPPSPNPTSTSPGQPFLQIYQPKDETTVGVSRIAVSGKTAPEAVVSINGEYVAVDSQGLFAGEVNLASGPNVIEVIASDFYGNQSSAILAVVYAAALPLTVTQPKNESVVTSRTVTVAGSTNVNAVVSINGKITPVDARGNFNATLALEVGPNIIEVLASDFAGNSASTIVTVIYNP